MPSSSKSHLSCEPSNLSEWLTLNSRLRLDDDLWTGPRTAAQVIADFGSQNGTSVEFDFGGGDTLRLTNTVLADLADDIAIV